MATAAPYYQLGPEAVIRAIESVGLIPDGRLFALNSYENRVYQIGLEEADPLVAKFYRPNRWSNEQILEEHQFALELAEAEIPLVAPMQIDGKTLHEYEGFRFALFRRQGGRQLEWDSKETRLWLGRFLGRIHAVGASRSFRLRPEMDLVGIGQDAVGVILAGQWLPHNLEEAFSSLAADLLKLVSTLVDQCGVFNGIRIHGDCHPGNILWRDGPFFVDLDDCRSGPAIQDLWMLLSGEADEMMLQLRDLLDGYTQFHQIDLHQLRLIEPLRAVRMLNYAAWIANRWDDPAFPRAFPWFEENRYWETLILDLREQFARMQEPPLQLLDG